MTTWEVAFDDGFTDAEKQHLETFKDELIKTFGFQSLRWRVVRDDRDRKLYRVTRYSNRSACLAQFIWADLEKNDPPTLAYKIKGGEFRCPDEQDEIDEGAERQAMLMEDADEQETATARRAADQGWHWDTEAEVWILPDGRQADRYGNVL